MNDETFDLPDEQRSDLLYPRLADRREFLQAAGGLAVLCVVAGGAAGQRPGRGGAGGGNDPARDQLASWLTIGTDGGITVFTGKVEIGQGIRTTLAQAVAEELAVPLHAVTMVMGDTARVPYDAGTFGSQTTPQMLPVLRRAGAAARELLLGRAAARFGVDAAGLTLAGAAVVHAASGRRASYAELVQGEPLTRTLAAAEPTPPERWTLAGKPVTRTSARAIVTGRQRYPSDLVRPGLLHGRVLRPAGFGATLRRLDAAAAEALPGVKVVHEGDFVGVVAPDEHAAGKALELLRAEWTQSEGPDDHDLPKLFRAAPLEPAGAVATALAAAAVKAAASYTIAPIQHAPLEPRTATAEWAADGSLTVWAGTSRPFGVRSELANQLRLEEGRVHLLMPDCGSSYGGKHTGEAAIEAARLAKAAGRPVKVLWTREEEFTWAYSRPCGVIDVTAGAQRDGTLTAWQQHTYNCGPAGLDCPYDVAAKQCEQHGGNAPLRQGSYRGLAGPANFFARESLMDELALAVGVDPLAFRLKNLTSRRLRGVLEAVAAKFGWGRDRPGGGHGFGLACGPEKGSFVATAVEVALGDAGQIRPVRIVTAFDCGVILNPNAVRNQVEGGAMMALGGALFERLRFAGGRITNPRFSGYRVPRMSDLPQIEVVLVEGDRGGSAGAGETPLMGIAPALANAVVNAGGPRLRALPLGAAGPVARPV